MRFAFTAILALVSGCAINGFEKYYAPNPIFDRSSPVYTFEKPPATPQVYAYSSDINADTKRLLENGYMQIGTSSFFGPERLGGRDKAIAQGKRVGASVIMLKSSYRDTLTGAVPYSVPNAPQVATVNTTGTVNGAGYNSTSTVTMPGGMTTYSIPYAVSRSDFVATYWAGRDPSTIRLGVITVPLPDDLRGRLKRNTGVLVPIVMNGTPAFRANILEGDVIMKINGTDAVDPISFNDYLFQHSGETVKLDILRGADPLTIEVALNNAPKK